MARKGGSRRKTSSILTKPSSKKGKISLTRYLDEFKEGEKVTLNLEPAVHEGMFNPRFIGKSATVMSKKGTCYEVKIRDLGKEKSFIVHPVHLKRM